VKKRYGLTLESDQLRPITHIMYSDGDQQACPSLQKAFWLSNK
jgi:hypothetical protein